MKVLIFEPWYTGHRCEYLRRIIRCVRRWTLKLLSCLQSAVLNRPNTKFILRTWNRSRNGGFARTFATMDGEPESSATVSRLLQSIKDIRPEHLYVPSAGEISEYSRFIPKIPPEMPFSEGLHLRGAFGYSMPSLLSQARSWALGHLVAKAPWSVFGHLDPWQLQALGTSFPQIRSKALLIPDPVGPAVDISKTAARNELGISEDANYIGFAGPLTKRKGFDLLLAAFANIADKLPANAKLLLAGPSGLASRELIYSQYKSFIDVGRIVLLDRHLSAREMDIVIPAMDIVAIPYRDHCGSSGIALRAAAANRPILGPNRYWLRNAIQTFGLGITCNVHDPLSLSQGIINSFQTFEA